MKFPVKYLAQQVEFRREPEGSHIQKQYKEAIKATINKLVSDVKNIIVGIDSPIFIYCSFWWHQDEQKTGSWIRELADLKPNSGCFVNNNYTNQVENLFKEFATGHYFNFTNFACRNVIDLPIFFKVEFDKAKNFSYDHKECEGIPYVTIKQTNESQRFSSEDNIPNEDLNVFNELYRKHLTKVKSFYFIPAKGIKTNIIDKAGMKETSPGGLMFAFDCQPIDNFEKKIIPILSTLVSLRLNRLALVDFQILKERNEKKILYQALKSALAAIMSRNGSHNIGSHVLAAVGNNYNDLPDDQILFKYIQHRMDYIAQIATEFPNWTSPTWFVRDLMRRFYMQRHLLNYISQSEGLGVYEFQPKKEDQNNKILIKIGKKNGTEIKYIIAPEFEEPDFTKDVQIAIPGGIIGHQAFYTIIENIVRNAAKHGWSSLEEDNRPKNLEITIEIDDDKNRDFIIFRIYDNVSKSNDNDSKFIDEINERLGKSFVDQETGKLLKSNWGLAEMKISAGFLNRRDILEIGSDNEDDILFKLDADKKEYSGIIRARQSEDEKSFGYEFAIPRPKEVLIIGMEKDGLDENLLQQNNIYLADKLTSDTDLDYEFVVMYDDGNNDFINKLKDYGNKPTEVRSEIERFPFRLFIVSDTPQLICGSRSISDRIVDLKPSDIALDQQNSEEEILDEFKLLLFKKWISHLIESRKMLNIDTVGGEKNCDKPDTGKNELKMLIHLAGNHGHSAKDIVRMIFYKFKDSLLSSIADYNNAKAQLEKVSDDDMNNYSHNHPSDNRSPYINANRLIDCWIEISKSKGTDKTIPSDLEFSLKNRAEIYFDIIKEMYVRYAECCQTLPTAYKGENSNQEETKYDDLCIDDHIKISITHDENASGIDIAYNRHRIQEANYYSEALSGSQIYFSLLQNLPNENEYNKTKMLLQLVENALLRVVIIDERAAQYCNCNDDIKKKFDKGLIAIPTQINHDQGGGEKAYQLVKNLNVAEQSFRIDDIPEDKYDILIIHQGMIDKLGLKETGKVKEFIDEIKESVPFVIITSGRGEPVNIPENVKFLPFSNIENFLLSGFPEKCLLTQIIMKLIA